MRYEKGRKDTTRQRIIDVAAERFRCDGIAGSGLAGIMSEAGLTNGAFYPHFRSKAELVRETVVATIEGQSEQMRKIMAVDGIEGAIAAYLSPEHRDNPETGCVLAALLPELARQPDATRSAYSERLLSMTRAIASELPPETRDPETAALAIYATLVGTLQLARAVDGTELSDRILAAGAKAARTLVNASQDGDA